MRKMSFFKVGLLVMAIAMGTATKAQENSSSADGMLAMSGNLDSEEGFVNDNLENVVMKKASASFLEEPGKMGMHYSDSEGIFTLSYVNDMNERVWFTISDSSGELVFVRASKNPMFHQRLLISELPEGQYTAVLKTGDENFKKVFAVKASGNVL